MIDIKNLKYKVVLIKSNGQAVNVGHFQQSITWEENTDELATRANIELVNGKVDGVSISTMAKLGAVVMIYFNAGAGDVEVFRGRIYNWKLEETQEKILSLTAYDMLYPLQQSKDNRFYKSGTSAKTILTDVFKSWGVPIGTISGLDISMSKKAPRNETLADIIFDVLSDVKKKGYGRFYPISDRGKVSVIKAGSNKNVYCFDHDTNAETLSDQSSIDDLVTRVKIVGKSKVKYNKSSKKYEDNPVVEAVVDGQTQFGILQEIVTRGQDEKLSDAKAAAKDILYDRGKPKRTITVKAPDVPPIRKGHKVYLKFNTINGNFIVKGVQHDASKKSMTMEVEPA